MGRRQELQEILKAILGSDQVYFQPPATVQMKYPSILYNRDNTDTEFAGNRPYRLTKRYLVTVIDPNPDSEIPDKIAALPMCVFNRHFVAENLNHDAFYLYF